MDLYNEFNSKIAKRYKIMEHKCRPVEKCYAFEHNDIGNVGQYLEVVYSSNFPALPSDLKGRDLLNLVILYKLFQNTLGKFKIGVF